MYSAKPGLIIGFHGCDKKVLDIIVSGKAGFKPSENGYDWLGDGMYFWENNQQRALDFALELKKSPRRNKPKITTPAVLGAVLDIGFCLDLLDTEYLNLVRDSFKNLDQSFKMLELNMPVNQTGEHSADLLIRELDCAVIENLHNQREKNDLRAFDSSRGVFVEGASLYPNAGFNEKNHIQICIRNPNCIKGFFIPLVAKSNFPLP